MQQQQQHRLPALLELELAMKQELGIADAAPPPPLPAPPPSMPPLQQQQQQQQHQAQMMMAIPRTNANNNVAPAGFASAPPGFGASGVWGPSPQQQQSQSPGGFAPPRMAQQQQQQQQQYISPASQGRRPFYDEDLARQQQQQQQAGWERKQQQQQQIDSLQQQQQFQQQRSGQFQNRAQQQQQQPSPLQQHQARHQQQQQQQHHQIQQLQQQQQQPRSPLLTHIQPPAANSNSPKLGGLSLSESQVLKLSKSSSRLVWSPVGKISVTPYATGPDEYIDVVWEIPSEHVPREMIRRQARRREPGDHSDDLSGDWIGLFRYRQRIDVTDGCILTREVAGRISEDQRSSLVRGNVRLRTPRGVGLYDFRYFRGQDFLPHSEEQAKMTLEHLPLARSNPVRVEIQGFALFEATEFIVKNMRDRKRLPAAAAQFASLVHQIRSLRSPLGVSGKNQGSAATASAAVSIKKSGQSNKKGKAAKSPNEESGENAQESQLLEHLWNTLTLGLERGKMSEAKYAETLAGLEVSIESSRKDLEEAYVAAFGAKKREVEDDKEILNDDADDEGVEGSNEQQGGEALPSKKDADPVLVKEFQRRKQQCIDFQKSRAQNRRERSSLGSSIRWMLEEAVTSPILMLLLPEDKMNQLLAEMSLFCPLEERFFRDEESLDEYLSKEHFIVSSKAVSFSPLDPRSSSFGSLDPAREMQLRGMIESFFAPLEPGNDFYQSRRAFVMRLQMLIDANGAKQWGMGGARLIPFGSSANGFADINSDFDMCLRLGNGWEGSFNAVDIIERMAKAFEADGYTNIDDERKTARIPLIRFQGLITSPNGEGKPLDCDICINNILAVRNTYLLRMYGTIDPRVTKMIRFIKHWAKSRNINSPSDHTLSSYGYILMVINYLQRLDPPLLPVLQKLPKDWNVSSTSQVSASNRLSGVESFDDDFDSGSGNRPSVPILGAEGKLHDTYFFGDPEDPQWKTQEGMHQALGMLRAFAAKNSSSVLELLIGFFWDVAFGIDWRRHVVSIRTGRLIAKEDKSSEDSWKMHPRIAIEDPFETSYDVAHVLRDATHRWIRFESARAFAILRGCHTAAPTDVGMVLNYLFERPPAKKEKDESDKE